MTKAACTDEEFIRLYKEFGPLETSRQLGVAASSVFTRRSRLEKNLDLVIGAPESIDTQTIYPARVPLELKNGVCLVGSDGHFAPDLISTGHRAFVLFSKDADAIVFNGDGFNGSKNGRHPPIGWNKSPGVKAELEVTQERLGEIKTKIKRWNIGNHDWRFDNKLSATLPEYEGVAGFALKDHFPDWQIVLSTWINDAVVVKHRFKGGIHATHNNTIWAGKTMVTGHLHSLKVTPFDDYNGTRWGVDTGTLADPYGPQFDYGEDNPVNHRSGFIVLTFVDGVLLWPEIVRVVDEKHIDFRGKLIKV